MIEARGELGDSNGLDATAGVQLNAWENVQLGAGVLGGVREGDFVYGGVTQLLIELGN